MGLIWKTKAKIQLTSIVYENIYRYITNYVILINYIAGHGDCEHYSTDPLNHQIPTTIAGFFKINLCGRIGKSLNDKH